MVCPLYFILLFNLECLLFVGSVADCMEFIAEKRQREGIFVDLMPITPDGCVEICEHLNTCFAVNYFRLNATCQLLNRTMPESKLVRATKYFYKSVKNPPKEFLDNDPCYQTKCMWDEICMHNTTTNAAECFPYAKNDSEFAGQWEQDCLMYFHPDKRSVLGVSEERTEVCETPMAISWTINESVELMEVGQNYTYRCQDGLFRKRDQNPTVTCLRDGHWTMTNFACVCETPAAIPRTINETVELEVGQNYTYRCQNGLVGKRDHSPTVTCLPDGHWTATEFTCVCNPPPAMPGAMNESSEVEVGQNYTYRCQGGLFYKGDQNPTVTCQHDGSWTSTNFICVKQNWTQDTIYPNNIHKSEVISNETGVDFLTCMQQCDDKLNNCLSFFYDNHTRQCVLSSSFRRGLPQDFNFSDGIVYYTAPSASCDMEYKNVSLGGSYFCIKFHAIFKTFNEAMKLCESEKAKLLVITTKAQVADAKTFISVDFSLGAFLGISDEANEGRWVSWEGEAVSPDWYPLEPSGIDEDCAHIYLPYYGVSAFYCNSLLRVLCHKKQL